MNPQPEVHTDSDGNEFELREIVCPTCGRNDSRFLGLRGGQHQRQGLGFESRIYRCQGCGLIYPNPLPIPKDPSEVYGDPEVYFQHHDSEGKAQAAESVVSEIARRSGTGRPAILDIGSGRGEILSAAERLGGTAVGLELSDRMIEAARDRFGVTVLKKTVEEFAAGQAPDSFDAVVVAAVLEHVYDPDSFVTATAKLLRPGGVLFLDLPREPSLLTWVATATDRIRGRKSVYYLAPTWEPFHLYGFNPKAIRALLAKHGFVIDQLDVSARPVIPVQGDSWTDRFRAIVGRALVHIGNRTRSAPNMTLWAHLRAD